MKEAFSAATLDERGIYGGSDPFLAEACTSRASMRRTLDEPRGLA